MHLEGLRKETIQGMYRTVEHRVHSNYPSVVASEEGTVVALDALFIPGAYIVLAGGHPTDMHSVFRDHWSNTHKSCWIIGLHAHNSLKTCCSYRTMMLFTVRLCCTSIVSLDLSYNEVHPMHAL